MGRRKKNGDWLDPLTGVFNREYFETHLQRELQRATRYVHPLSILLLDINEFKKLIDEFDRRTGDRVLQELSQILKETLRTVDVVARYGDDAFIMLLPETKKAKAKKIAERILRNIKNFDFFKNNLQVKELNVSIGVAGFPEDTGRTAEMIKKVDNALYQAKKEGGCRIVLCE